MVDVAVAATVTVAAAAVLAMKLESPEYSCGDRIVAGRKVGGHERRDAVHEVSRFRSWSRCPEQDGASRCSAAGARPK